MRPRGLIALDDVRRFSTSVGGWLLAALTPRSGDRRVVALLARLWSRSKTRQTARLRRVIEAAAPRRFNPDQIERLAAEWFLARAEISWGRSRAARGRDEAFEVELAGADRLREALALGRGAVLWAPSFCDSYLWFKGLTGAGFRVAHLSRISHGAPSGTWFGRWALAGLQRLAEDRYLDRRIVLEDPRATGYVKQIDRWLAENALITVRADLALTEGSVPASLFGRTAWFMPGAPTFAWRAGAALLPIFCRRVAPFRYRLEVDSPIELARDRPRREAVAAAVEEFARRLESRLDADSSDYEGWWWIRRFFRDG